MTPQVWPSQPHARRRGRYWPSDEEIALLRAGLLDGGEALAAWEHWRSRVDFDRLDAGAERLLPLAAHNLRRSGVGDPRLGRYDGLVHYTWVANQRRVARVAPIVRAFHVAGIPSMLLKGMALARHYYGHMGLRPMDDVDLLVPTADARRAMAILRDLGCPAEGPEPDLAASHSRPFEAGGGKVDLHWHALWELCGAGADEGLWARAESVAIAGTPAWILSPADSFLHVVVHGARWNAVNPVRWVADAMTILSSAGERFDWTRLAAETTRHALVLPVAQALSFLAATFGAPVPLGVLAELVAHRPSGFERLEHRMREMSSPRLGCFPLVLCHHVRLTRAAGPLAVAWRLPRYLQGTYGLPSLRQVPAALCERAARRLRRAAAPTAT